MTASVQSNLVDSDAVQAEHSTQHVDATVHHDLLAQLAGVDSESALGEARQTREAATVHAQGSYDAIFAVTGDSQFALNARFTLAQRVSSWHGDSQLAAHYAERLHPLEQVADSAKWQAALAHAERLSFKPASATGAHLQTLLAAGWSNDDIVTLSQLVAFVSFQTRLLRGLRLLNDKSTENDSEANVPAGVWRTEGKTESGRPAPQAFTQDELKWEPWIPAKTLAEFDEQQQATLARFGHTDSDYFRLLGRNLPVLEQRTLTDKGIFYTSGGLPRKERELAATVASKVNGCVYCASVHARKAAQLSKQPEAVQRLLDITPGNVLSEGQEARWQAEIDFSAALSATPPSASAAHIQRLRDIGLSELELLDLAQSTAFFAWANRLMLTLGEPFEG